MSGEIIDDFHEHTIRLIQEMKVERDLEKSKVAVQQNEVLKTREALQIALFNSKSKHAERSMDELAWKDEIDAWKQQCKLQESEHRNAERLLRAEVQRLDEQYKEEHFAAVRSQAEYATALQKARAEHSVELASANAELMRLKEQLATVTKQHEATNPEIERLVTDHLADERAMETRHKAQCNELQRHIDCMLAAHQKDLQALTKQNEEAREKLVLDHQRHMKDHKENTIKAIQNERRTVRATMLREQQKQQIALQEAEENLDNLLETLNQIEHSTSNFVQRRDKWKIGQLELRRLMREIQDVSHVAGAALEESASMFEAYTEQKRLQILAQRETEIDKRELTSRGAEVEQLIKQLQRREEEEERMRARSQDFDAQIARLQLELERNEIELSRVREELSACRGGGMESEMEVLGKSLALSRELVLKERELKGVEAKLRESEQAVARLEAIMDEREADERSARAILADFQPGELESLRQEVEELRQAVQEKEEEVQHWQGEGLAAEDGMGHAIRALQESKARVEQEIEQRQSVQTELNNTTSALKALKAELATTTEAERQSQRELLSVSSALQHVRAHCIRGKQQRGQRDSARAALRDWARVAVGEVDWEACQTLARKRAVREGKCVWNAWACERLRAERCRVAAQRVLQRCRLAALAVCLDGWVDRRGWKARSRLLCAHTKARRSRARKETVMTLWQQDASRRRGLMQLESSRPEREAQRVWGRWKARVRDARHRAALRKQAVRCVGILSLKTLCSAWMAWAKAVELRHSVSSMAAHGLMDRCGGSQNLVAFGRMATALHHVIRLWMRHVSARHDAQTRVDMLQRRQWWRRMSDAWTRWDKAVWCAMHRTRWVDSAATSVCFAGRRRHVSACWQRWQAAWQTRQAVVADCRRSSLHLARVQVMRWRRAALDSAAMRRREARAVTHAIKSRALNALRSWDREWRRRRKQLHGTSRMTRRRRRDQLHHHFSRWGSEVVAARLDRETARAQTLLQDSQAAKTAFEKDVLSREKGWELVESKMVRDLRRLEAAARGIGRDLADFPMEQAEEAVERARRAEAEARQRGERLAEEMQVERTAREIEEETWRREREQREVREQRLTRERDDAEGLLAAFRVGCEGAVARIDRETKLQLQALAQRAAEAQREKEHAAATIADLNAKLLAQRRALVSLAQHRANADCIELPIELPSSHYADDPVGPGSEPRARDLEQFLAQASRGSASPSRALSVGFNGLERSAGCEWALDSVAEEEEEVFGMEGSEEGVAGMGSALRALERHRAERERVSGRLREALLSNKKLSGKNRELSLALHAMQQQRGVASSTLNPHNPFDSEN